MSLFLDWIFPKTCYFCNKDRGYICVDCLSKLKINHIHNRNCEPLGGILNLHFYDGKIKDIIFNIKYNFISDIIPTLSNAMAFSINENFPNLLAYWRENDFILVPIPLHNFRQKWRGFNQSQEIVKELSKKLKLETNSNFLFRSKNTISQIKLDKVSRSKNMKNVFSILENKAIPQKIILVDDVSTTLSTLKSATLEIKKNNPNAEVWGLTIAGYY